MSDNLTKHHPSKVHQLRADAEARLAQTQTKTPEKVTSTNTQNALLHELQVHQIELEMQNEHLQQAQNAVAQSRDRYIDLYEFSPIGYFTLTGDGLMCEVNLKACAMLGVERKNIMQRRFAQFIAEADKDRWYQQFLRLKQEVSGNEQDIELILIRKDGSTFHAHINCLRLDDSDTPQMLRLAISDISKLKRADEELRIAAIAFDAQEGIFITDAHSVIMRVNDAFTRITGYTEKEAVGQTPRLLNSGKQDQAFYAEMWNTINLTGTWEGELWNRRKSGEVFPEHVTITAVKDASGNVSNYVATLNDITESKASIDTIQHMALYDPLTNLPHRRLLIDRLKHTLTLSSRLNWYGALLFLDIDYFKTINDTLGHEVGDFLLQQVAERLTANVREGDTVSRLGGDEFVVLLDKLSDQAIDAATLAETIAHKILLALSKPYLLANNPYKITVSIGIALFKDHEQSQEVLLKNADIAMYQAKKNGRNNVCFFDPQMQITINKRATLERNLHQAIEKHQFQLHYQIQVNSAGKAIGAEALIRWLHHHELVYPFEFIPLAEETGLILPIGLWVLESACAQLKAWEENSLTRQLTLSINVSAKQFHQVHFVEQVITVVKKYGINPKLLKLELTESMLLDNIDTMILTMHSLKKTGIQFELDDFGTGYSSLQYLKKLPLHQLKIDQSFVRDITSDSNDQAIVSTIIAMSNSLDLKVIAEGVETEGQRQQLENKGCKHYQGYLFGKPMPIDQFEALLRKIA